MATRRGFLGAMAAAPLASKAVAEGMLQQTGISSGLARSGLVDGTSQGAVGAQSLNIAKGASKPMYEMWQEAFRVFPEIVGEQESLLFEQERVQFIDPDLAVMRSFSMNAKIAFQKQRNVARRMQELQKPPPWQRYDSIMAKINKLFP